MSADSTPRTDAVERDATLFMTMAKHARTLERELAEARRELADVRYVYELAKKQHEQDERELAQREGLETPKCPHGVTGRLQAVFACAKCWQDGERLSGSAALSLAHDEKTK